MGKTFPQKHTAKLKFQASQLAEGGCDNQVDVMGLDRVVALCLQVVV